MSATVTRPIREEDERVFTVERRNTYPVIEAFEDRHGFALDKAKLEAAARVLASPVKANPPNWQHGRVIYAATMQYLSTQPATVSVFEIDGKPHDVKVPPTVALLDIGTAKGFSALCLAWALSDSGCLGTVTSVDVIDPMARVSRNTVAETDGFKTLHETIAPWPESQTIRFVHRSGIDELKSSSERIHVAFIDGKHSVDVVTREGHLLAKRQQPGDLAIFDDVQLIGNAVVALTDAGAYTFEYLEARTDRGYAIGVRRG